MMDDEAQSFSLLTDPFELAAKIYTPAYISLETILAREGIVFQHDRRIFVVSYLTREISCDGRKFIFRRIRNVTLANPLGMESKQNYVIASAERAFLETLVFLLKVRSEQEK